MREYPSRPGKALRPALCLSAGRAFGAEADDLLGIAVAIELLHNAFLVHDDIADGSEMRRGRPTLAAAHGMAAALNAGDGLAVVAGQVLRRATRRLDRDLADLVWAEFDTMAMRTLEGQATEVGWQLDNVEELEARGLPRTDHAQDVLVHHHSSAAGRRDRRVRAAPRSWRRWCGSGSTSARRSRSATICSISSATRQTYGKEILGDLYEGKRTLPLVHLLANATGADRELVRDYLRRSRAERSPEMVADRPAI